MSSACAGEPKETHVTGSRGKEGEGSVKTEGLGLGSTAQRLDIKCRNGLGSAGNRESLKVRMFKISLLACSGQSHSHPQCHTQAQFPNATVPTQHRLLRRTPRPLVEHSCTEKHSDTFGCTETQSLYTQVYNLTNTRPRMLSHTESQSHRHTYCPVTGGTISPTSLCFLQEASKSRGDKRAGPGHYCYKP